MPFPMANASAPSQPMPFPMANANPPPMNPQGGGDVPLDYSPVKSPSIAMYVAIIAVLLVLAAVIALFAMR